VVIKSIADKGIGDSIGNQVVERQLSMIRSEIDDLLNKIRVSK